MGGAEGRGGKGGGAGGGMGKVASALGAETAPLFDDMLAACHQHGLTPANGGVDAG